ncbi:MAG: helix-turn-helix domain-containing protein [Reichenbachiella sp.]
MEVTPEIISSLIRKTEQLLEMVQSQIDEEAGSTCTISYAAKKLGLHRDTIITWCENGVLAASQPNGPKTSWVIQKSAIRMIINTCIENRNKALRLTPSQSQKILKRNRIKT